MLEAHEEDLIASGAAVTICHSDVIQAHRDRTYSLDNYPARVALGPYLKGKVDGILLRLMRQADRLIKGVCQALPSFCRSMALQEPLPPMRSGEAEP